MRLIPSPKNAQESRTCETNDVSHSPHFEQWLFAGNLCGQSSGLRGVAVLLKRQLSLGEHVRVGAKAVHEWNRIAPCRMTTTNFKLIAFLENPP